MDITVCGIETDTDFMMVNNKKTRIRTGLPKTYWKSLNESIGKDSVDFGAVPDKPLTNVFLGTDRKVTESDLSMIISDEVEPEPEAQKAPLKEWSMVRALTAVAAYPRYGRE